MKFFTSHPSHRGYLRLLRSTLTIEYPFTDGGAIEKALNSLLSLHKAVSAFNDRQVQMVYRSRTGRRILPSADSLPALSVDPFRAEPWLAGMRNAWVKSNSELITSLTGNHKRRCQNMVLRSAQEGWSGGELKKQLVRTLGVSNSRAELIAVDQTNKANAALNQRRFQDLGATQYIWRCVHDNSTRPEHLDWDGKTFNYSDPDHPLPGVPVRCRCHDEPVFDDLDPIQ